MPYLPLPVHLGAGAPWPVVMVDERVRRSDETAKPRDVTGEGGVLSADETAAHRADYLLD